VQNLGIDRVLYLRAQDVGLKQSRDCVPNSFLCSPLQIPAPDFLLIHH
jgi:hypothetical protein